MNIFNKVANIYLKFFNKNYYKIIQHNKKYFKNFNNKSKNIILIEFNRWSNLQIVFSYIGNYLSKKYESELVAFPGYKYSAIISLYEKLTWWIGSSCGKNFLVYKSFGVKKFLIPCKKDLENYMNKNFPMRKISKLRKNFINLKINQVKIGDAIYDSYLKENRVGTAEIYSQKFYKHFKKNISLFLFWDEYLKKNKVKAICTSHSVYHYALLVRLGIKYSIPTFVTQSSEQIYRLNNKSNIIETNFKNYPKIFARITKKNKKIFLNFAKKKMNMHLKGRLSAIPYVYKSSFSNKVSSHKVINPNKKIKILIASQCFIDAPHNYGDNLFVDHLEWLNYLAKFINSKKNKYDWYLKTHNNLNPISENIIYDYLKENTKIKLIPKNIPNNKIAKDGIDFVLTCWGSVGFEFAAMNINVINASKNNPHIKYNFNHNPKSIKEYFKLIENLNRNKKKINKLKVLEYFFMKFYFYPKNWLLFNIENPNNTPDNFGNTRLEQTRPVFFNHWTNYCNADIHSQTLKKIKNFVDSKNYCFMYENLESDLNKLIKNNVL